jgi:hypothetical protein
VFAKAMLCSEYGMYFKQFKNGNNEELHFNKDVRKQEQATPDRQRNTKSAEWNVTVKQERIYN